MNFKLSTALNKTFVIYISAEAGHCRLWRMSTGNFEKKYEDLPGEDASAGMYRVQERQIRSLGLTYTLLYVE